MTGGFLRATGGFLRAAGGAPRVTGDAPRVTGDAPRVTGDAPRVTATPPARPGEGSNGAGGGCLCSAGPSRQRQDLPLAFFKPHGRGVTDAADEIERLVEVHADVGRYMGV